MLMKLESYLKIGILQKHGRRRQANRMMTMCDLAVNHVVVDLFVHLNLIDLSMI